MFSKLKALKHVGLDFDLRVFAQNAHVGQAERFGDTVRSTSRYPGPGKELRSIPGAGM
jgi:hypothetical protein